MLGSSKLAGSMRLSGRGSASASTFGRPSRPVLEALDFSVTHVQSLRQARILLLKGAHSLLKDLKLSLLPLPKVQQETASVMPGMRDELDMRQHARLILH